MAERHNILGLEIDEEDVGFLHKEWRFQRIGWATMGLLALLALFGFFGDGAISHERAGDPNVFAADFERVMRHQADTEIKLTVGPGLQRDSILRIGISRAYLDDFQINSIEPQPSSQGDANGFTYYDFLRRDARQPMHIVFNLEPSGYWHASGKIALAGATTLDFGQIILP